jgi:predicted metal-dependent peptidase
MLTTTKPRGGGGTEVQCVVDYMKEKNIRPVCVVVLTDGYLGGDWGTGWDAPVLWCITTDKIVAPIGKSIYVEVE